MQIHLALVFAVFRPPEGRGLGFIHFLKAKGNPNETVIQSEMKINFERSDFIVTNTIIPTSQSVAASNVSARTEWDCGPIKR